MKERVSAIAPYILKHKVIADLGIGKGYYYSGLDLTNKDITGVDLSNDNLKKLHSFYPSIKIVEKDIRKTELPDHSFDFVVMSQVIEHVEDYWDVLKEAKRICKSGGYFLIAVPTEDHHKLHFHPIWTEEMLKEISDKMGETITIRTGSNWRLAYIRNVEVPEEDTPYDEGVEKVEDHVSVIFCHYAMNPERSALARASLKSLQATMHVPAEIIVIDNGDSLEDSMFFLNECQLKRISVYIRNADNMHFSYARNQAMPEITGKWVVIADNDIMYKDHWLELGINCIKHFSDRKLIASPINYPYVHKRDPRWRHGQLEAKGRHFNLTERAGSNCMIMKRETYNEMGKFELHKKAGCLYTDKLVNAGYLVITPAINWAFDAGLRKGFNFTSEFAIKRTLSDGNTISFT